MKRPYLLPVVIAFALSAALHAPSQPVVLTLPAPPAPFVLAPNPSGGDDIAALEAARDATPDDGCLLLPTNATYQLSRPWVFYSRILTVRSFGRSELVSANNRCANLQWIGTTPTDAAISCNWSRITLENLTISCDANGTPPARGIRVDQWQDATRPPPTINSTHCILNGVTVVAPKVAGNFIGIDISPTSSTNCEFNRLSGIKVQCPNSVKGWGVGVQQASSNSKQNDYYDVSVSYANAAFVSKAGSFRCSRWFGNGNAVDFEIDGLSDPSVIEFCSFEQSGMALRAGTLQDSPLTVRDCRWGSVVGPYVFDTGIRQLTLTANKFQGAPPTGQPQTLAFNPRPQTGVLKRSMNLWSKVTPNDWQSYLTTLHDGSDWPRSY